MAVQHPTYRDRLRAHLLGGEDSPHLEFDAEYFQLAASNVRLVEALRNDKETPRLMAVHRAVATGIDYFHPELDGNDYTDEYRGFRFRYQEAAKLALHRFAEDPNFDVDTLPVDVGLLISPTELKEVGRLALQVFRVYAALAETGEVPEL